MLPRLLQRESAGKACSSPTDDDAASQQRCAVRQGLTFHAHAHATPTAAVVKVSAHAAPLPLCTPLLAECTQGLLLLHEPTGDDHHLCLYQQEVNPHYAFA
jgi:hypothetical protein